MADRRWGHESRSPRDRFSAPPAWPAWGDADRYDADSYDAADRYDYGTADSYDGADRYADAEHYPEDHSYPGADGYHSSGQYHSTGPYHGTGPYHSAGQPDTAGRYPDRDHYPQAHAHEPDRHHHGGAFGYDGSGEGYDPSQPWPDDDRWRARADATGEWVPPGRRYEESWQTGTGWLPAQRRVSDESGYPADPRDLTGYPQATRGWDGEPAIERDVDRDDWYERRSGLALPATRRAAETVPVPRPVRARQAVRTDEDAESDPGYLSAGLLTTVWYVVPVLLYGLWMLTLDTTPDPNCLDPAGDPCAPPRTEALNALVQAVPRLATAISLSLVIALIIRWNNNAWRSGTIGFASAVVGAGITTAIFSVFGTG